jgi:hypothetical protein
MTDEVMIIGGDGADYQEGLDFGLMYQRGYRFFSLKGAGGRGFRNGARAQMATRCRAAGLALSLYDFMYEKDSLAGPGTPDQEFDNFAAAIDGIYDDGTPLQLDAEQYRDPAWGLPDMTTHMVTFARRTRATFGCPLGVYMGTSFWRENGIDIAALVAEGCYLWLPSWQAEKPGAQYLDEWGAITIWQNGDDTMIGPVEMDHDIFYGGVEDFKALGRPATPLVDRYAELRQPYGPLGHTVHPYFHADYGLDKYGYPLGPAVLYSDRVVRQVFERGIWGSTGRSTPGVEAPGQALRHALGDPASVIADYPAVHPLLP